MADQIYMASVESTYAAMEQMLQFSAVLDVVSRNADERTVTFSVPGINGLFTAKVAEGDAAGSSKVTVTAPIDGGDKAQESVAKFYKDLGDQLMVQGAVQSASEQTPVFDAQNQPTQTFQAPVPTAAGNGGNPAQGTKNKFVAMLTDTNTGKTSVMAIAAAVVSAVFLIFGFVSLGMHPPVVVGIIFAVVAAVLCALAYTKTQPGREHGRMLTVVAAGVTVVALTLSLVGAAGGSKSHGSMKEASSSSSPSSSDDDPFCKPISWPSAGVGAKAPKPNSLKGYVWTDDADYVNIKLCDVDDAAYTDYLNKVKDSGFVEDYKSTSGDYSAKDSEGNFIDLTFFSSLTELDVTVKSAERYQNDLSEKEKQEEEAEAKKKAEEEAKNKAEAEKAAAEEAKKAEEEQKRLAEEEKKLKEEAAEKQNTQSNAANGVTPDVKEALDGYETFMNKYCDFMEKYAKEGRPAGMLTDYLEMLNEYTDYTQKLSNLDQSAWTDADMNYFIEVTNRVNQRLASVS